MALPSPIRDSSGRSVYRPPDAAGERHAAAEAGRWLESELRGAAIPPLLIVIGLGDGQLLDVLETRAPATRVLALEPDAAAARAFLSRRDRAGWIEAGRLTYLAAPGFTGAADAWRVFPPSGEGFALLTHPRLEPVPEVAQAAETARKIVFGVRANAKARRRFAPRYLRNAIRNVPAIIRGHDAGALAGRYAGVPAVITAAGPSLDSVIGELPAVRDRALLIATDTTLRPLLAAGAAPHIVVAADPGSANARHFLDLPPCGTTWLAAESALDPSAVQPFMGRTLWFRLANHHPWPWLQQHGLDVARVEMWGSVLTAAFELAHLAGCDPILIAGADLAFTEGRPYCRGTTYEFDWALSVASGSTLEDAWQAQMSRSELLRVQDSSGRATTTTRALLSFRDWMLTRIPRSGRRVVNVTGAGLLFGDGIEQGALGRALGRGAEVAPFESWLGGPAATAGAREPLRAGLERLSRAWRAGDHTSEPLGAWAEFVGGTLDIAAVQAAVDDACAGIEAGVLQKGLPTPLRKSSIVGLAESSARWRRALQGVASEPAPPRDTSRLLRSLAGLAAICDAVASVGGVVERSAGCSWLDVPASVGYEWPEPLRWRVQQFEAGLADACGGAIALVDGSFVTAAAAWHARQPAGSDGRPAITPALLRLAMMWVRCAVQPGDGGAVSRDPAAAWAYALGRLAALAAAREGPGTPERPLRLELAARTNADTATATIPLDLGRDTLARALTGLAVDSNGPSTLGAFATADLEVSLAIVPEGSRRQMTAPAVDALPRVLTSEGLAPSDVAYRTTAGVVCVTPYARRSLVVQADGTVVPHLEWPHPIVGELPFGEGGAVAWSNGMHDPAGAPPCVMYRTRADERPAVEPLDVRPTVGAWWQGRLYWSCFPTPLPGWVGVVSWAPGEGVRLEIRAVTAIGMHPDAEGLRIEPCVFRPLAGYERRRATEGWLWDGVLARPVPLGPEGALSSVAACGGWVARAYPEADLVRFENASGARVDMACRHPRHLAWIDGSLLVSTVDREVLLFTSLRTLLERS